MGDRVSISFRKGNEESVVLFSHWQGYGFAEKALDYADRLRDKNGNNEVIYPLDRLEPNTVMVDFIRHVTKDLRRVESDLYLASNQNEGDNSDNGHFVIDLDSIEIVR